MKCKVLDSFYSSELRQMHAGQEFDPSGISEARLKEWEKRGYIEAPPVKSEPAPKNKAEPPPDNKETPGAADGDPGTVSLGDLNAAEKLIGNTRRSKK